MKPNNNPALNDELKPYSLYKGVRRMVMNLLMVGFAFSGVACGTDRRLPSSDIFCIKASDCGDKGVACVENKCKQAKLDAGLEPLPEIAPEPNIEPKAEKTPDGGVEPVPEITPEPKVEVKPELVPEIKAEPVADGGVEPVPEVTPEPKVELKPELVPEIKAEPVADGGVEPVPEVIPEPKVEVKPEPRPDVPTGPKKGAPGSKCKENANCNSLHCTCGICSKPNRVDYSCKTDSDCKNYLPHIKKVKCHPGFQVCQDPSAIKCP